MRTARIERKTGETQIELELDLDGTGQWQIDTGVGFFDHMLSHEGQRLVHRQQTLSIAGDTRPVT